MTTLYNIKLAIRKMTGGHGAYDSETSKFRRTLSGYCVGNGIDIGYGGDPITPSVITVDLEQPYSYTGDHPLNLKGDARDLHWFRDGCLDYVYSSHLLEDFEDKEIVLKEWVRVLKKGGNLILLLPDEERYRRYERSKKSYLNPNHKDPGFNIETAKKLLTGLSLKIVAEHPRLICAKEGSDYNFAVIAQK